MAAGNVLSGKAGTIKVGSTEWDHVLNWKLKDMVELHPFASNSTGGRKKRVVGVGDCSGSFDMLIHAGGPPPVKAGDTADVIFHMDASTNKITAQIVISDVEIETDIETGKPISYNAKFEGNGTITYVGGSLVAS